MVACPHLFHSTSFCPKAWVYRAWPSLELLLWGERIISLLKYCMCVWLYFPIYKKQGTPTSPIPVLPGWIEDECDVLNDSEGRCYANEGHNNSCARHTWAHSNLWMAFLEIKWELIFNKAYVFEKIVGRILLGRFRLWWPFYAITKSVSRLTRCRMCSLL